MPYLSIDDPNFWDNCHEEMKHLQAGRDGGNVAYFLMGEGREDNPPTVLCLKLPPGGVIGRHAHHCYRFEIIVRGTLDVGDRVLKPGDVMVSAPEQFYGPHTAGPEGCTTFEIFSDHKGSHMPIMEMAQGLVTFDVSVPGTSDKVRTMMREQTAAKKKAEAAT